MNKLEQRRQEEREERRSAILATAQELFYNHGVRNVTIGQVADSLRLSRSLIYTYFKDLNHILCSAAFNALSLLHESFQETLKASASGSGVEGVSALGRTYIEFAFQHPEQYQSIQDFQGFSREGLSLNSPTESALDQQFKAELQGLNHLSHQINVLIADELSRGIKEGSIRSDLGDPLSVALSLWAQTSGLIQFCLLLEHSMLAQYQISRTEFLENGIRLIQQSIIKAP
ncbi:hypothetical protein COW36_17510 [bacterium (Candidatus Blackallbacteria) CG17_big_fil_post_rev_8_21_14_2_50_48_46]|uniref:HTH tetR-type domain-containing protein n=1 Tax=bacterium (Candidatus Blackallbacteria) CG17_big_fil_post_rev_8_21_14_2_50_48_46 TaxID=2014261 RepID=A0A2M7G0L7_9BACT|nr:MAG: hypothetical protein COW64_01220 [bacterium (Candidatus Blackallbacteria) CG18_big_fil_WC_8_21_14_2_50_49_26]PIW15219.1 MAG: hypothetical protein COW36_17510 [bacterium (Candidatus Blackallbacteria) CG17_big_fil_post_rev_8_21_14_2_50_48_46]PIW44806.1 MAG: hypothetical protein COW20_22845 [bacterium (Candidatus Blackallbacteria) CG13_big_fil_rev_8_21_14_2_50_49_14]